jgi:hypothetical protein
VKRPQRGPQPPPTYTSFGAVPDGYVTWNASRSVLGIAAGSHGARCFAYIKTQQGTVRLGGKVTDRHRLN